jgi:hypothetical protein
MTTRILGPFNRVEGDLEVHLDIADGKVAAARVNSPLYRGFEQMLPGKSPLDALVIVPRICGICSVAQSAAAAAALRDLMGLTPPPNGRLAEHLIGACENLADHLTHFYLFFMPDFARPAYQGRPWFPAAEARFKAVSGSAANDVLPARAEFMHLMGLMAGKWPHTLSLQPGGTSRPLEHSEILRLITLLRGFRRFLERHTFGDDLESVAGLDSLAALDRWREGRRGDLALFLAIADDLGLDRLGRATDRFLSHGAYGLFPAGVWDGDMPRPWTRRHRRGRQPRLDGRRRPAARPGPDPAPAGQGRCLHLVQGAALWRTCRGNRRPGAPDGGWPSPDPGVGGRQGRQRHGPGAGAAAGTGHRGAGNGALGQGADPRRTLVPPRRTARRGHRRRPGGSRPGQPGPLARRAPRPHRQLPDHRPHHLELLAA